MKTTLPITGGCLCGNVRYQIAGPLLAADHCHCSLCRRQHGAAFATYARIRPEEFEWVLGEDQVTIYETPAGAGWCFCSKCGSSLAGTEDGTITTITLGTIEGDPGIRPDSHIFVGSKAHWYDVNDDLAQFEERSPES